MTTTNSNPPHAGGYDFLVFNGQLLLSCDDPTVNFFSGEEHLEWIDAAINNIGIKCNRGKPDYNLSDEKLNEEISKISGMNIRGPRKIEFYFGVEQDGDDPPMVNFVPKHDHSKNWTDFDSEEFAFLNNVFKSLELTASPCSECCYGVYNKNITLDEVKEVMKTCPFLFHHPQLDIY